MDIELLQAFKFVAEHQSFSSAAEQLHLTQSAISKRIALLEQELNQTLFDRVGRNIRLTEAGQTLLPRARIILQEIENTKQAIMDLGGDVSGCLRIATSHHIGLHRLPKVLKRYSQLYPKVHLDLHFLDSEQALKSIIQGQYDLAIITLSQAILTRQVEDIEHKVIWQDPMAFISSLEHPLNQHSNVSLKKLTDYPAILPDRNTYTTQLVQKLFDQANLPLNIAMTTNHLDAIKMMISVGLGWSILPMTLMDKTVHQIPVKKIIVERQLGCIYLGRRTISNAARSMLTCLYEAI